MKLFVTFLTIFIFYNTIFYTSFGVETKNVAIFQTIKIDNSTLNQIDSVDNLLIYPNPFNPTTNIIFKSNKNIGTIKVYDILGSLVEDLGEIHKGINYFKFTANIKSSGIYFVRIKQDDFVLNKKIIYLK